eukprot:jgi/Ulvmu1/5554/UM023_0090.1
MGAQASQIVVITFFGSFFFGYAVWWCKARQASAGRRRSRAWARSRAEVAAQHFAATQYADVSPPASVRAREDPRIPFIAILPDNTLDVALLEDPIGAHAADVMDQLSKPAPGQPSLYRTIQSSLSRMFHQQQHHASSSDSNLESFSRRLRETGVGPLPASHCHGFEGIPDSLVWSVALLDPQHPLCSQPKLSSSSKLASLFRLANTSGLTGRSRHVPVGSSSSTIPRSMTGWWSARSQDLPSVTLPASRAALGPVPTDADPRQASMPSEGHGSGDNTADPHRPPSGGLLRTTTPVWMPPVSVEGPDFGGPLWGSPASLRRSGRLGSLGGVGSLGSLGGLGSLGRSTSVRSSGHEAHAYERLNEVVVA